jgi:Carboxypeptidase regulatory-like domain
MQNRFRGLTLSSAMLAAMWAVPSFGQTFGEVTGRISDPTGAAIPTAQITLTNTATNAVRTTISTDSGDYTFPAVVPGAYNVKVEKTAFKSASSTDVQVQIQQTVRLDFTLQVGQVSESVEVSASAQMLQAENVSLGTVIENKGVTVSIRAGQPRPGLPAQPHIRISGWLPAPKPMRQLQLGLKYTF